jgi:hypothetical protein
MSAKLFTTFNVACDGTIILDFSGIPRLVGLNQRAENWLCELSRKVVCLKILDFIF